MKVKGKFFEITDFLGFVRDPNSPHPATFRPLANLHVTLVLKPLITVRDVAFDPWLGLPRRLYPQ